MKQNKRILAVALAACASMGSLVMAKEKVHHITFEQNTMVKGTMVKKGEYEVKFDEQTKSLTLLDGKHTIVTTSAREEALPKKAAATSFDIESTDQGLMLRKITFGGDRYTLIVDDGGTSEGQ